VRVGVKKKEEEEEEEEGGIIGSIPQRCGRKESYHLTQSTAVRFGVMMMQARRNEECRVGTNESGNADMTLSHKSMHARSRRSRNGDLKIKACPGTTTNTQLLFLTETKRTRSSRMSLSSRKLVKRTSTH
jgi:hypothetical protein